MDYNAKKCLAQIMDEVKEGYNDILSSLDNIQRSWARCNVSPSHVYEREGYRSVIRTILYDELQDRGRELMWLLYAAFIFACNETSKTLLEYSDETDTMKECEDSIDKRNKDILDNINEFLRLHKRKEIEILRGGTK